MFQEQGTFNTQLLDGALETQGADAGGVVCGLDFIQAALEVDAFLVVGLLDRWGQRRVLSGCVGRFSFVVIFIEFLRLLRTGHWQAVGLNLQVICLFCRCITEGGRLFR